MRTISIFKLLALLLTQSIASASSAKHTSATPSFPNVVLTGRVVKQVMRQCSRYSPSYITVFWTLRANDIKQLENDAPAFLIRHKDTVPLPWNKYACQYAGYVQNGHKMIYVNCAPRKDLESLEQGEKAGWNSSLHWRHQAFGICDGGPRFFGMEYDVQAHQFHNLRFDGPGQP